jgi:meiotically up-regulated gene 157 (Mug157) protein
MVLAYTKSWGAGGTDFWAFEIDGNGNLLYSATYGGNVDDIPYMGINTSDGGYIFPRVGLTTTLL